MPIARETPSRQRLVSDLAEIGRKWSAAAVGELRKLRIERNVNPCLSRSSAAGKIVDAVWQDMLIQERPDSSQLLISNGLTGLPELVDDLQCYSIRPRHCRADSGNWSCS
jgi:hypothetical protein